ncbi:thiamine phosphate synthase [Mariniluteicoccus flavus]
MTVDWRVHVVTSGTGAPTVSAAAAAARAGAGMVQVRAKEATTRELLALVRAVADAVSAVAPATTVIVDDRADVAYAARRAGAHVHGVHLGQDDLAVADARAMLGSQAVIGLTTGTRDLVVEAESRRGGDRPDYLGAGPFRPTPTKDSGREPLGLAGYPPLVAATSLPIIAIGDVRPDDVASLAATGIAGVALVRAIMGAADPGAVVERCLAGWQSAAR